MEKDNIKTRLENLNIPEVPPPIQQQLKLAIINSKKSLQISLWLLGIPFLVLFSAMLESFFHLLLPPWSWIKNLWSFLARMASCWHIYDHRNCSSVNSCFAQPAFYCLVSIRPQATGITYCCPSQKS